MPSSHASEIIPAHKCTTVSILPSRESILLSYHTAESFWPSNHTTENILAYSSNTESIFPSRESILLSGHIVENILSSRESILSGHTAKSILPPRESILQSDHTAESILSSRESILLSRQSILLSDHTAESFLPCSDTTENIFAHSRTTESILPSSVTTTFLPIAGSRKVWKEQAPDDLSHRTMCWFVGVLSPVNHYRDYIRAVNRTKKGSTSVRPASELCQRQQ